MSKRVKKSSLKIKSSDGDEFEVDDDIVTKMETLKAMTMLVEDDEKEQVPTCQIDGGSMRKVILWTDYQNNFKNMNLKDTFQLIMSSDYLGNESLSEEMLRRHFSTIPTKILMKLLNSWEVPQLSASWMISKEGTKSL